MKSVMKIYATRPKAGAPSSKWFGNINHSNDKQDLRPAAQFASVTEAGQCEKADARISCL